MAEHLGLFGANELEDKRLVGRDAERKRVEQIGVGGRSQDDELAVRIGALVVVGNGRWQQQHTPFFLPLLQNVTGHRLAIQCQHFQVDNMA